MSFFTGMKPLPKAIILAGLTGGLVLGGKWVLTQTSVGDKLMAVKPAPATQAAAKVKVGANDSLRVSIVSFHGYAPALVANGNSLTTKSGSIFANMGADVELVLQDNVPTLTEIFTSGTAQCAWRTSDFWAQEHPNLRNAGLDAQAVMVVDNTQGGDAIIAKDPSIRTVEDLAGHSVALVEFTPSHGLLSTAVDGSSLTPRKKQTIRVVPINADEGTPGVRAAYAAGKVDAAVLWDPDLSLTLKEGGGHVVYSTAQAKDLIYDVIVCDSRVLTDAAGRAKVEKLVAGWLEGVKAARANPDGAVQALIEAEPMFAQLAKDQGADFIKSLFKNVAWTDLADNARILGLAGGTNQYERVYKQFDGIYREAGSLANPNSPVIAPQMSFDYSFVKGLLSKDGSALAQAAKPTATFTQAGAATANHAVLTKPVAINFEVGSATLTAKTKKVIDTQMVPFIESNSGSYIELSGHTDSTGSASDNLALSARRAAAVRDYLVGQWEVDKNRLKMVGRGSSAPICQEPGTADGLSLDECRALNRSTRVAVLGN